MPAPSDNQVTGMAGEFLVVGQLFKRGIQASLTLGNAKSVDVLAYNAQTNRQFAVSVKTLRRPNCFPLDPAAVRASHIYVFVVLNSPGDAEEYFVVSGRTLLRDLRGLFGSSLDYTARWAVNRGPLKPHRDRWDVFDAAR